MPDGTIRARPAFEPSPIRYDRSADKALLRESRGLWAVGAADLWATPSERPSSAFRWSVAAAPKAAHLKRVWRQPKEKKHA